MNDKVHLLNATIDNITMEQLLEKKSGTILTLHVDMIVKMQKDRELWELMKRFDVVTCDSQILYFALKWLGQPLQERVSGSDYFPKFYTKYKDDPSTTIFLCGAMPGIAERARDIINQKVGREMIVGTFSPSVDFEKKPDEIAAILKAINDSKATVCVVGLGVPKQERFIFKYRGEALPNVRLFLPLGGTIDYEAGDIVRPSPWVTEIGLEWAYRLVSEPKKRWRRYLVQQPPLLRFLMQQKLGTYRNPFN